MPVLGRGCVGMLTCDGDFYHGEEALRGARSLEEGTLTLDLLTPHLPTLRISSQNASSEMQHTHALLGLSLLWGEAPCTPSLASPTVSPTIHQRKLCLPGRLEDAVPSWPAPAPPAGSAFLNPVFMQLTGAQEQRPLCQTGLPPSRMNPHGLPQPPGHPHAASLSFPVLF